MYFYKIYGITIRSEIELPLLVRVEECEDFDAEIVLGGIPSQVMDSIHANKDLGIGKNIIWFVNHKGIFVITNGNRISVQPRKDIDIKETHIFIMGYSLAKMFWQRVQIAMHCSAVELFGGGLIISGYSGSGKSTLTTRFINQGCRFIADDVALVGRERDINYIYPAFPYQKLCKDAVIRFGYEEDKMIYIGDEEDKDKYAVNREDVFSTEKVRLGAMCVLREYEGERVQIREVKGADKLQVFRNNLFLNPMLKYTDLPMEHSYECVKIVSSLPIFILERPYGIDSTIEQMKEIEKFMISTSIVKTV